MPVKPQIRSYGSSIGKFGGKLLTDYSASSNMIDAAPLGDREGEVAVEFSKFEKAVKDFCMARLGHPVIRVELTDFQIQTAIDEAITHMSHHAPMWMRQFAVFRATAGENVYILPQWLANNLSYVVYKKSLLTIAAQSGTLEFDFFIKYFQDNHLFSDFSVGEFFLLQQHLEQLRKVLSQEGTWDIIDGNLLQIYPTPVTDFQDVILEYRALNSDTIHPAYRSWINRYALASCQDILGETRSKYKTLPGPGGGAQLNGEALLARAEKSKELLMNTLIAELEEPAVPTAF